MSFDRLLRCARRKYDLRRKIAKLRGLEKNHILRRLLAEDIWTERAVYAKLRRDVVGR